MFRTQSGKSVYPIGQGPWHGGHGGLSAGPGRLCHNEPLRGHGFGEPGGQLRKGGVGLLAFLAANVRTGRPFSLPGRHS